MKRAKRLTHRRSVEGLQSEQPSPDNQCVPSQEVRLIRCGGVSTHTHKKPERQVDGEALQESNPVARVNSLSGSHCTPDSDRQQSSNRVTGAETARVTGESGESLAVKRRRMAEEREARLVESARAARPVGMDAFGRSPEEQRQVGLEVLTAAHALVRAGTPLDAAVQEAGEGGIRAHYAQRLLFASLREPVAVWMRSRPVKAHQLRVLEAAMYAAGGVPPATSRPGPKVSTQPPSPEEVERRRALVAAAQAKGGAK